VAGRIVDVGAESLHVGAPPIRELIRLLGLTDRLVVAEPSSAWIWAREGLHRVPAGVGPAGPTRLGPILRSRLLSTSGLVRAAVEPLTRRTSTTDDLSVGDFITRRFGRQVTERFVDPMLGTLHSGDVSRLSLHAVAPHVAGIAAEHRSIVMAHRARQAAPPPSFATLVDGLPALVDRLVAISGATVHVATRVRAVVPVGARWRIEGDDGTLAEADAVVLAVPARIAAQLLAPIMAEAAEQIGAVRTASVATVVAAYPREAMASSAASGCTGLLVPSSEGRLLKAATFLSAKWRHLDHPDRFLVRLAAGRAGQSVVVGLDDTRLAERLHDDLADIAGVREAPVEVHVERWHNAMPQLEVGHLERLAAVRRELAERHPTLVLAGASYDGPGLAACVRSGDQAARRLLDAIRSSTPVAGW
jgi:protoporphyrinogen/coproporphyrinogen III oxidase